jgi:hypothetical protein
MHCLRLAFVLALLAPAAWAQPTTLALSSRPVADRNASDADNRPELEVTLSIQRGAQPYEIGTFQPIFTFNDAALEFPGQTGSPSQADPADFVFENFVGSGVNGSGENYTYRTNTVTNSGGSNEVQVNVALSSTGAGQDVPATETPIVRIYFKIDDPSQTADLNFSSDAGTNEILLSDNQTLIPASDLMFVGDDGQLPVELVAFEAQMERSSALLSWRTASETNNSGFSVEARLSESLDARTPAESEFSARAWVEGAGTTTEAQSYAARIDGLAPGRYAFRLRQQDLDGAYAYGPEVELVVEAVRELRLEAAWPNPVRTSAQVGFAVPRDGRARIEVYDLQGRLVSVAFDGEAEAGRTLSAQFDAGSLAGGVYLLRLSFEGEHKTGRVVVAR